MKDHVVIAVALIVLLAGTGAGVMLAPSLQDAQRTADAQAARSVEGARRLLSRFNVNLDRLAQMSADLKTARDIDLTDASDRLQDESFVALYEDEVAALTDDFGITGARRPSGPPSSQVRAGLSATEALMSENDSLLRAALDAADGALSIRVGSASTSGHCAANRLRGLILYFQGQSAARRASDVRARAVPVRAELAELALRASQARGEVDLVAATAIDDQIQKLDDELRNRAAAADAARRELADLEATIATAESELARARSDAAAARARMDELRDKGIDFGDPDGFSAFEAAYQSAAADYRAALSRAQAVEHGTLPHAHIDPTGDLLRGTYLENGSSADLTVEPGLVYYRAERRRVATAVSVADESVTRLEADLKDLRDVRKGYEERQAWATRAIADAQNAARERLESLRGVNAAATELEHAALQKFDAALASFSTAERAVADWVNNAITKTREMSPQMEAASGYAPRKDDDWIGAHIATERATAQAAQAWVHVQRYLAARTDADLLESVGTPLDLPAGEARTTRQASADARTAGMEAARAALEQLERAHQQLGQNWTVAAEYAGTAYVLVLLGDRDRVGDVVANYRNALSGREDAAITTPLKDRLDLLEKM